MIYQEEPFFKCDNVILEVKRVLLNEQLDRIANMTLSEDIIVLNKTLTNEVNINNDYYEDGGISSLNAEVATSVNENSIRTTQFNLVPNKTILEKYFQKWKAIMPPKSSGEVQTEKLDDFIENLKNHRHESPPKSAPTQVKRCMTAKSFGCFKHRYKTQKNIIDMQRSKIEEQTKIINELKVGIIREDLLKSIENTKIEIRDIFSKCSDKLFSQAPLLKAVDDREKIMIKSQQAPKMVQKMQQRAIERAKYREIILERKRLIEEARQKLLEEAIEKKKALEEEERKRSLEIINEQRKRELHLQKMRQEKKQEFERKLFKAVSFYNKLLKKQCFIKLLTYYLKAKENFTLATEYYICKQKRWIFNTWLRQVEAKYEIKYQIADALYEYKVLKNAFAKLKQFKLESVRSQQVAEDLYDFRLASNTFIQWHIYVCKQIMLDSKKMKIAIGHSNRRLLFHYFYQWRSLPVVIQLEKAKEEKKRKWREKVWEILPDYQPPEQL